MCVCVRHCRAAAAEGERREAGAPVWRRRLEAAEPAGRRRREQRERQGSASVVVSGRRRVVASGRGERDDDVVARAGAGGRADVDGGHRAQPGAQQQPAGVDPARRLRPHLVPLHRLHLHARRGRGLRPLALK